MPVTQLLEAYARIAGEDAIDHLRQLSEPLRGLRVVHVNSTRRGGGVAEILHKLVPLMQELGVEAHWEVITGGSDFYACTKSMHNALQGSPVGVSDRLLRVYEETNRHTAEELRPLLEEADVVFIHDPQPAALVQWCPDRRGKWIWRCHIDVSRPHRPVWRYLRRFLLGYDASIFSLAAFAQPLPHPAYLVPPSIDPLSEKNVELGAAEVQSVYEQFGLDPNKPMLIQVSRYDRFKDPVGVIHAYRVAKRLLPRLQLVLAGGSASDDPEGEAVLAEVRAAAEGDPDVHVLLLPADAHRTVNALQRAAAIVLQKSLREGFGLTVTEGMWKARPVIGGDTGGIRLQVVNYHTGFLVSSPEGAALRIRYLLHNPERMAEMGRKAQEFVRENFLLTRQLRDYLALIYGLTSAAAERIELR
jgi:trehalose synthase